MKRKFVFLILFLTVYLSGKAQTWDEWFNQKKTQRKYLVQQIAKLQVYLTYVKKGYNIVSGGLSLISDIKNGDFNLHQLFFSSLKKVNPKIKKYEKVADIIALQFKMLSAYKDAFRRLKQSGLLTPKEIEYCYNILTGILNDATEDLQALTDVLTDGTLEMKDNERIARINAIDKSMSEKSASLQSFIEQITELTQSRKQESQELQTLKNLYGL